MGPADGPPLAACFKVPPTMAVRQLQRQVPPTSLIIRNRLHPGWDGDPCHQVAGGPARFAVRRRRLSVIESPDEQAAVVDRLAGGRSPQGCAAETAASSRREDDHMGPDSLGHCRLLAQSSRDLKSRLLFAPKTRSSAWKSDSDGMKVIFSRGLVDL